MLKSSRTSDYGHIGRTLPVILFIIGLFLVLIPSSVVFVSCAFLSALVGVRALYLLVFKTGNLRLTWVLATGLLLGYGVGTFNTAAQLLAIGSTYFGHDLSSLCVALAVAVWVSALMYFAGSLAEAPVRLDIGMLQRYDQLFLWASLAIVALAYVTGGIGYMGADASAETHHESPLGAFSAILSPLLPGFTVLLPQKSKASRRSIYFWILLGVEFAALLPQGRRVLIYSVVVLFIALTLRGSRLRLASGKTMLLLITAVLALYVGNKLFYAMRYERTQSGRRVTLGLIDNVQGAFEIVLSGDERYAAAVQKNLRERTFVLGYFSDLLEASWRRQPLWGRVIVFDTRMAIPAFLDRNKEDVYSIGIEETLVNPEYGLVAKDEANSILTTGLADFGLIGCFAYPFLLCLIFSRLFQLSARWLSPPIRTIAFFSLVFLLLQTEFSTSAYIVTCRNLVLISTAFTLLEKLRNTLVGTAKRARGKAGAGSHPLTGSSNSIAWAPASGAIEIDPRE
jgi:hypothetical protein